VANNKINNDKNAGKSLAILIAMRMQRYNTGYRLHCPKEHIQGFTQSHWMSSSIKCLRRITPAAAMVINFKCNTQNTSKTLAKR
jgi:hypothetical protein